MSRTPYLDLNIPDKSSKGFVVTDVFEPNFTKLDQEAERVNLRKMSTEDNIEELKKANRYKLGDVVEVLGFHKKGDGSHHKRVAKSEDDGSGEQGQNGIWWCIIHSGEVNVSWFGAKGDGITDDTDAIQNAINLANIINFEQNTYMINSIKNGTSQEKNLYGIKTRGGITINFNGSELKAIKNNSDRYTILRVEGDNIILNNPYVVGDRDEHIKTPSTNPSNVDGFAGEWGYGLQFVNCKNVLVMNPRSIKCWGDSYIIDNAENLTLVNPYASHSRRQGISLISGVNIKILNPVIESINGTMPQSGIDIEPDDENEEIKNVYIENLITRNNSGKGLLIALIQEGASSKFRDIRVNGFFSEDDYKSFELWTRNTERKTNITLENIKVNSFYLELYNPNLEFNVINSYIEKIIIQESSNVGAYNSISKSIFSNVTVNNNYCVECSLQYTNTFISEGYVKFLNCKGYSEISNTKRFIIDSNTIKVEESSSNFIDVSLYAFNNNYIHFKKRNNLNLLLVAYCIREGSSCKIYSETQMTLKPVDGTTLNNSTNNVIIPANTEICIFAIKDNVFIVDFKIQNLTALDTPYHATQMSKLGILDSYHNYLSELHEYEKSQNVQSDSEIMALNVLQPPVIPTEVEAYAKEYNLI